ncbi:MAG: TIGR02302 family protein [Hyphomicrobium sp.]
MWGLVGLLAVLLAVSLSGVFLTLSAPMHMALMTLFAIAAAAALVYASRVPWPGREEAIRRIERRSGVAHRPATSYEDTLTTYSDSPETQSLWQAHRERLSRAIGRLRVGRPSPRADRFDPIALRALPILLLIPAAGLVTGSFYDRLSSAFRFGKGMERVDTRVDAWVTPPAYTALPPIMLADGADQAAVRTAKAEEAKLFEVPAKSSVTLRGTGFRGAKIALEVTEAGAKVPVTLTAEAPKDKVDVAEVRLELKTSARVRALAGGEEVARWTFDVIPDQLPKITLDKEWDRTAKGSLKLSYSGEDDYGIATGQAKLRQIMKAEDQKKAWARAEPLKGPRLPLEHPPEIALKIPQTGAKTFEATSLHDLGAHPWAGQTVELWLEVTDVAGQTGRSEKIELALPMRSFRKPLARAVIEQRRKLAEDSRNRPVVVRALDALTIEPEGFIEKSSIYLGLRTVYHRIERENTRIAISSAIDQLWDLALKIEDGALSDAEKDLKDAQDRLAKALQEGASEEEIKALMQELKQAMNKYLEEMQKNAEKDGDDGKPEGEKRQVSKEDMEQMMRDIEENAKNGSREEAEKLLAEMKEMMENMRADKSAEAKAEDKRAEEMLKKLNDLSNLSGKQQKLMDDTFKEQKEQQQGQQKGGQQKGQQKGASKGQGKAGEQGGGDQKDGAQAQQRGKDGQQKGQSGESGQAPDGRGGLKDRQSELRKNLEKLQRELGEMGEEGEKLGKAKDAMQKAEEALEDGDNEEASEAQSEALDQMRQSAQKMAEQMQKGAQQRAGRGEDKGRDPLDRPQRAEGPDLGNSVKVPNAIDAQRAREILDELRRRSGEALRPPSELDYIERLLKRF